MAATWANLDFSFLERERLGLDLRRNFLEELRRNFLDELRRDFLAELWRDLDLRFLGVSWRDFLEELRRFFLRGVVAVVSLSQMLDLVLFKLTVLALRLASF